jgi:hypothetical protein
MENDAREHLNLAHYNFNRMAVIDEEEGIENNEKEFEPDLISTGTDIKVLKNMHNTTSGFYPSKFGDRVPTRGDV